MRIDRCLQILMLAGVLGGCQLLQDLESSRRMETARTEHANCVERGYDYPGLAYTECRMDLHDKRLQQRWMELQMSLDQQAAAEPASMPRRSAEPYRPLRLEDYRCEMRQDAEAQPWIHCFEDVAARQR